MNDLLPGSASALSRALAQQMTKPGKVRALLLDTLDISNRTQAERQRLATQWQLDAMTDSAFLLRISISCSLWFGIALFVR
ncbi:hypothetical protein AC626_11600 [Pseudoalteromonas rubra]|uniref:Uncharacterized protein n=1 Tax=Pseudoalteromonas rubra TaxID=43658 RepID=A0A0L0ETU7_9GAMM|nr:hypothetical protein AC626_11600 [Pseudoalteromonas rubra]